MSRTVTAEKAMRIIRSKPITRSLANGFAANGWSEHLMAAAGRAAVLFSEHADASRALTTHLEQLLPMIALYEKAKELTGSREAALAFFDQWAFIEAEKMMKLVRPLMKAGLYRLMPSVCEWLLPRMFGRSAGFDYRRVPDAPAFAADMTRCPYVETCAKYGVPELAQISCKADDITYGNLHPRLVWARTQTLGTGGSCCDFRLYVKEENSHDHP
ncbi:MAG: L-2-amino-thiazoline-4-carboxylic acid hydrolase [Clostridia bacterium]|nr:L-2-amino-thiazoline-4-carboxylic acid hydrolase [Clostridia bacterium]